MVQFYRNENKLLNRDSFVWESQWTWCRYPTVGSDNNPNDSQVHIWSRSQHTLEF